MKRPRDYWGEWRFKRALKKMDSCGSIKGDSCICCLNHHHYGEHFCIGCGEAWYD